MNVSEQIVEWAKTIPSWQCEAVRRLLQQESLTADDESHLYALLKTANGLPDPTTTSSPPGTYFGDRLGSRVRTTECRAEKDAWPQACERPRHRPVP